MAAWHKTNEPVVERAAEFEAACLQSHTEVDRSTPKTLERCREVLRLSDEDFEGVRERAATLAEALKDAGD